MILTQHSRQQIPLALSMIAAGPAIEVTEDFNLLDVNELITGGREGYLAFEVTGNSMPPIEPGYIVFVDSWRQPKNGDVIATEVNGLICIKQFKQERRGLFLVSANREYEPRQITERDRFRILGVVRGHLGLHR